MQRTLSHVSIKGVVECEGNLNSRRGIMKIVRGVSSFGISCVIDYDVCVVRTEREFVLGR